MHYSHRIAPFVFALMRVVQALGHFSNHVRSNVRRNALMLGARGSHHASKVWTFHILHAQQLPLIAVILKLVNLNDVRMVQASC